MHILCWDSTVLGKEGIQLEEQLPLCIGIELTVIRLWAGMKYLSWYGVRLGCCS